MITENEKTKIQLEEAYRAELKKKFAKKRSFMDRIDGPMKLVQALAIAIGIIITLLQYRNNSESERAEAARNYQKSFYEEQMNVYAEAVTQASIISTVDPKSDEYEQARLKFLQLFWGRMSMFEDKCVEEMMLQFRKLMLKFDNNDFSPVTFVDPCSNQKCTYDTVDQVTLKKAALRLAHQSRFYTIHTWLPKDEQEKYNLDEMDCSGSKTR